MEACQGEALVPCSVCSGRFILINDFMSVNLALSPASVAVCRPCSGRLFGMWGKDG